MACNDCGVVMGKHDDWCSNHPSNILREELEELRQELGRVLMSNMILTRLTNGRRVVIPVEKIHLVVGMKDASNHETCEVHVDNKAVSLDLTLEEIADVLGARKVYRQGEPAPAVVAAPEV